MEIRQQGRYWTVSGLSGYMFRTREQAEQIVSGIEAGADFVDGYLVWPLTDMRVPGNYTSTSQMVECDCGHAVKAGLRLTASTGTSCPDCYDRMS